MFAGGPIVDSHTMFRNVLDIPIRIVVQDPDDRRVDHKILP
jgi:hypothetical protein